jgi:hypothetical protein
MRKSIKFKIVIYLLVFSTMMLRISSVKKSSHFWPDVLASAALGESLGPEKFSQKVKQSF